MLRSIRQVKGCKLGAIDGDLGRVLDVYFDDQAWAVRYLVVDTRRWWPGKQVLISPSSLGEIDVDSHVIPVSLTQEQVRTSPDVSTHLPVSRQRENELAAYYGWPMYWVPSEWEQNVPLVRGGHIPGGPAVVAPATEARTEPEPQSTEAHLRSAREAVGYRIHARDGFVGHVEDFLVDDYEWMVRYLIVDTRSFWPSKSVLLAPQAVLKLDWAEAEVAVDLDKATIENAPAYDPQAPVSRQYEQDLHQHYGWMHYWM